MIGFYRRQGNKQDIIIRDAFRNRATVRCHVSRLGIERFQVTPVFDWISWLCTEDLYLLQDLGIKNGELEREALAVSFGVRQSFINPFLIS